MFLTATGEVLAPDMIARIYALESFKTVCPETECNDNCNRCEKNLKQVVAEWFDTCPNNKGELV
jgi:hypothetical protein